MSVQPIAFAVAMIGVAAVSFSLFETVPALISCVLGWTMVAIAASDLRSFIVPDVLSLPAIPAGLIVNAWVLPAGEPSIEALHFAGAAALGAISLYCLRFLYARWRGHEGLGLGDVKLAAVAGGWTGLDGLGPSLLVACVLALTFVLICRGTREITSATALPFGAFLAPSIWLVWIVSHI
jgi:leader peptidase (prepilin peptidase)/N-methyltransferase